MLGFAAHRGEVAELAQLNLIQTSSVWIDSQRVLLSGPAGGCTCFRREGNRDGVCEPAGRPGGAGHGRQPRDRSGDRAPAGCTGEPTSASRTTRVRARPGRWPPGTRPRPQRAEAGAAFALGRIGEAADTAGVVVFLASSDASFITGQVIYNTGGQRGPIGRAG